MTIIFFDIDTVPLEEREMFLTEVQRVKSQGDQFFAFTSRASFTEDEVRLLNALGCVGFPNIKEPVTWDNILAHAPPAAKATSAKIIYKMEFVDDTRSWRTKISECQYSKGKNLPAIVLGQSEQTEFSYLPNALFDVVFRMHRTSLEILSLEWRAPLMTAALIFALVAVVSTAALYFASAWLVGLAIVSASMAACFCAFRVNNYFLGEGNRVSRLLSSVMNRIYPDYSRIAANEEDVMQIAPRAIPQSYVTPHHVQTPVITESISSASSTPVVNATPTNGEKEPQPLFFF